MRRSAVLVVLVGLGLGLWLRLGLGRRGRLMARRRMRRSAVLVVALVGPGRTLDWGGHGRHRAEF